MNQKGTDRMKEYSKPSLEVLGELHEVTAASGGPFLADLVQGIIHTVGGGLGGS